MFLRRILSAGSSALLSRVKETTGIVGLDVVPNAREVLISLYSKTLKGIQAVPAGDGYRKAVESFTRYRLQVCEEEDDWERIEKRLACGQVEELIEEAKVELKFMAKIIEWDPWGLPDDYVLIIEDSPEIPKHVPRHISPPSTLPKNGILGMLQMFTSEWSSEPRFLNKHPITYLPEGFKFTVASKPALEDGPSTQPKV